MFYRQALNAELRQLLPDPARRPLLQLPPSSPPVTATSGGRARRSSASKPGSEGEPGGKNGGGDRGGNPRGTGLDAGAEESGEVRERLAAASASLADLRRLVDSLGPG